MKVYKNKRVGNIFLFFFIIFVLVDKEEKLIMENTNNKITETKFTQNDVLKGMLALDDKQRNAMSAISIDHLTTLLNDEEELNKFYVYCNNYVIAYHDMKRSVEILAETVHKQKEKSCEVVIADMAEQYKRFSREERLELCKRLAEALNIENSLDMLSYVGISFY